MDAGHREGEGQGWPLAVACAPPHTHTHKGVPAPHSPAHPSPLDPKLGSDLSSKVTSMDPWRPTPAPLPGPSPDVILIGKDDDGPGVGRLQEAPNDLVKLPWLGLPRYLHRLGNTHAPCRKDASQPRVGREAGVSLPFTPNTHFLQENEGGGCPSSPA